MLEGDSSAGLMKLFSDLRASKSLSGFTKSGESFVLVYKASDGSSRKPIQIAAAEAVRLALAYESTGELLDKRLNASAASLILRKARKHGWNDSVGPKGKHEPAELSYTDAGQSASSSSTYPAAPGIVGLRPKYFPRIGDEMQLSEDTLDELAFVLSGIDPRVRLDPVQLSAGARLKFLTQQSAFRIAADHYLQQDHHYTLYNLRRLDDAEFKARWEHSKSHSSGQHATDLQRLSVKFEKLKLDRKDKWLNDPGNRELLSAIEENAMDILTRLYRRMRRKLEQEHAEPDKPKKNGWLPSLAVTKKKAEPERIGLQVDPAVRQIVLRYLGACSQLGTILRAVAKD